MGIQPTVTRTKEGDGWKRVSLGGKQPSKRATHLVELFDGPASYEPMPTGRGRFDDTGRMLRHASMTTAVGINNFRLPNSPPPP